MSTKNTSSLKRRKWEFPRIDYLRENPELLLKGDTLKVLRLAAMLDSIRNTERDLKEAAKLLENL